MSENKKKELEAFTKEMDTGCPIFIDGVSMSTKKSVVYTMKKGRSIYGDREDK